MSCLVIGRGSALGPVVAHLEKELGAACMLRDRLPAFGRADEVSDKPDLVVLVPPLDEEVWEELENFSFPCPVLLLPPGRTSGLGQLAGEILSHTVTQAKVYSTIAEQSDSLLQLLEKGFRHVSEGIVVADADWNIIWVNDAFTRMTGYAPQEVLGKQPFFLETGWDNRQRFAAAQSTLDKQGMWQGKVWFRHRNGETHPRWVTVSKVTDAYGRPSRYVAICAPMAARDQAPAAVAAASYQDALTGLGPTTKKQLAGTCASPGRPGPRYG
jgi:PAS domain S-box-containing protein